jgi:mannitol-specific phosphotransferase system IIBC component
MLGEFFKALETEGGQMAVTIFMILWLGTIAFIMHQTGHDPAETGKVLLSNAFTGLMTLLITKLGGKKQP